MYKERIEAVINRLEALECDALMVLSSDAHLNEYLPIHNRRLQAISGFTGSAGTVVLMRQGHSHLFVDSRYHIQAEEECGSLFEVHKLGMEGVFEAHKWIGRQDLKPLKIAVDPFTITPKQWNRYQSGWEKTGHRWEALEENAVDLAWENRPEKLNHPPFALGEELTGESSISKLGKIRDMMKQNGAEGLVLTMLDEIAWLTNLRGSDIAHNPVFEAYAVILQDRAICFCHHPDSGITKQRPEWEFFPYDDYLGFIQQLAQESSGKIWLDPEATTMGTRTVFDNSKVLELQNPVVMAKACKNRVELNCSEQAHLHAAAALVRTLAQLEERMESSLPASEAWFAELLQKEYSSEAGFVDLSFPTIAGAGSNGAIVHYGTPSDEKMLEPHEMLLVDSGIQCEGGTTDCTRTMSLGEPTSKQKELYTSVLQAHIRLAKQVFPEGTHGAALDSITRSGLWNQGLDYGHGTGHGVGAFLNVHEGPQRISPVSHDVALKLGMIISNEPGYYETGWGGIRLENLCRVKSLESGLRHHPGGKAWLGLETLMFVPFDQKLIIRDKLSSDELNWLDDYHEKTYQKLQKMLNEPKYLNWLKKACFPLEA